MFNFVVPKSDCYCLIHRWQRLRLCIILLCWGQSWVWNHNQLFVVFVQSLFYFFRLTKHIRIQKVWRILLLTNILINSSIISKYQWIEREMNRLVSTQVPIIMDEALDLWKYVSNFVCIFMPFNNVLSNFAFSFVFFEKGAILWPHVLADSILDSRNRELNIVQLDPLFRVMMIELVAHSLYLLDVCPIHQWSCECPGQMTVAASQGQRDTWQGVYQGW